MTQTTQTTREAEIHMIDLSELYHYGPQFAAEKMLETILKGYSGLEYRLLFVTSQDIGTKFFDTEFKEFFEQQQEQEEDIDIEIAAIEFAEKRGYDIITLYDGYELAAALVKEKDQ